MSRIANVVQIIVILITSSHLASAATASITALPAYASQRSCARGCFGSSGNGPNYIANEFHCNNPVDNTCFCRADLQAPIDAYISSCVSLWCSGATVDISSATSLYGNYCTNAGYLKDGTTPTATTQAAVSNTGTPSRTSAATFTASTTSNANSGGSTTTDNGSNTSTGTAESGTTYGGLSFAELIGVIIGVLGFIASAIGAWFTYKMFIKKKRGSHNDDNNDRGLPGHSGNYNYPQCGGYHPSPPQGHPHYQIKPLVTTYQVADNRRYRSPPPQYAVYNQNIHP